MEYGVKENLTAKTGIDAAWKAKGGSASAQQEIIIECHKHDK